MMKSFVNLLVYLISFGLLSSLTNCEISDKRLCADPECKTLVSLAKTLVNYPASEDGMLSFQINKEARIYSKSAGSNPEMWGVEIQGQQGYVNKKFLREYRVLKRDADLTEEVATNLLELREKKAKREEAKLKSSQPEDVAAEVTTTSPLPGKPADKIVTDNSDVNSNTERPIASPVQGKIEVVDGTTVLIPEIEELQNETGAEIVDKQVQEPDDDDEDEITVENESEEVAASEEVQEQIPAPKSADSVAQEPIVEQVNASSEGAPAAVEPQQIKASQDDEEIPPFKPVPLSSAAFASAELEKQNHEQETSTPVSDDVRPVNEDVDETIQPDNKQHLEEQDNSTAATNSFVPPEAAAPADEEPAPTTSELPETIPKEEVPESSDSISEPSLTQPDEHENQTGGEPEKTEEQLPVTTEEEKTEKNESVTEEIIHEEAPQENVTETLPEVKEEEKLVPEVGVQENVTETVPEEEAEKPAGVIPEAEGQPPDGETITNPVDEPTTLPLQQYPPPPSLNPEQGSQTPATIPQPLEHDHHHHPYDPYHHHNHDHAHEHPQFDLPNLELTTASYEQEQYVPNPLHDDLTTTSQPAFAKSADLQPEVVTEQSLPAVESDRTEHSTQAETLPPVVVDEPENAAVPSEPEPVPSAQGSATLVEPVAPTEDKSSPPPLKQQPADEHLPTETKGLFDTILGTVNNFWSNSKATTEEKIEENLDDALEKLLFPDKAQPTVDQTKSVDDGYCENLSPDDCPSSSKFSRQSNGMNHPTAGQGAIQPSNDTKMCLFESEFLTIIANKLLEMTDFIICLGITALTILIFTFGHYCISSGRKENALVSKLNIVERSLLTSTKESAILKHDLIETRNKLASIEDNSFGSNDMVIALRKDLEISEFEKNKLQEHVTGLEKELEHAAEAGLELNKIVSELLNNQSGDDSIISSVEELQKQLNEQQNTILEINTTLAEKSRENSELQMLIGEINAKFQEENDELKSQNEIVLNERNELQAQVDNAKSILEAELAKMMAQKNTEIEKLVKDLADQVAKYDDVHRKYQASEARVEALEDSLDSLKKNPNINMKDLLKATENKTEVLSVKKERDSLKERLEGEMDARKLLEDHVKIVSEEVSALKQEYNQSEKEKLEAQTRLEVLSSYFKEKETQLQKELSVKEAMWMKQQGETTSTVERVRLMQDEIQALKSQNDSLRAEIEAQSAAHKAQIASLENRAHETWLASRQSDRKLEEARSEATALRRKLTSIAGHPLGNDTGMPNRVTNSIDGLPNHDLNQAPSPIHMESPGSPLLGGLPPPPPFLPPPFMGPPHPYMPLPPPFMPPGEMRPPPLGRLMSPPPPPPNRYSPSLVDDRDRYSPENGRYTPDSRYNYNTDIISTYDTETDFSPPPSPHSRSRGGGGGYNSRERDRDRGSYKTFSPPPNSDRSKKTKGSCYSDSEDDGSDW